MGGQAQPIPHPRGESCIAVPCTEVHGTAFLKQSSLISDRLPLHLLTGLPDRRLGCCILHNSPVSMEVRGAVGAGSACTMTAYKDADGAGRGGARL